MFYVQHLLGIGHLQRALRISEALVHEGIGVTLVCGGPPVALPRDPSIDLVQLTPIRARDARFDLVDSAGRPWLVDFSFSELAATPRQAALDVAELLASLAGVLDGGPAACGAQVLAQDAQFAVAGPGQPGQQIN